MVYTIRNLRDCSHHLVSELMNKRCSQDHEHTPVLGGSKITSAAGHYTKEFSDAVVGGFMNQYDFESAHMSNYDENNVNVSEVLTAEHETLAQEEAISDGSDGSLDMKPNPKLTIPNSINIDFTSTRAIGATFASHGHCWCQERQLRPLRRPKHCVAQFAVSAVGPRRVCLLPCRLLGKLDNRHTLTWWFSRTPWIVLMWWLTAPTMCLGFRQQKWLLTSLVQLSSISSWFTGFLCWGHHTRWLQIRVGNSFRLSLVTGVIADPSTSTTLE